MTPVQTRRLQNVLINARFWRGPKPHIQSSTQVSLWPSNMYCSCSSLPGSCPLLHWCLLSSIYYLLPQKLPLHCSSIRGGSALVWTWETVWQEQDEKPAYDSGWDQMPEEDFSSRIIVESHLSGVTSQLAAVYVSQSSWVRNAVLVCNMLQRICLLWTSPPSPSTHVNIAIRRAAPSCAQEHMIRVRWCWKGWQVVT